MAGGRRALAVGLVLGWVGVVGASLWAFELRYQLPADAPRRLATHLKLERPVLRLSVRPDTTPAFELGEAGGPVTVLHFWDAACPSAALNEPVARALAERYRALGVRFVVVAAGGEPERAARAIGAPVVTDPLGRLASAVGAYAVPFAAVVDGQGVLRHAGTYHLAASCGEPRPEPVAIALDALLAGLPPPERPSPEVGCPLL